MSAFEAKYRGSCAGGCDGIEPGDEVEYVDGVLMHTDCENSEGLRGHDRDEDRPPCPDCFLIHPEGACDA